MDTQEKPTTNGHAPHSVTPGWELDRPRWAVGNHADGLAGFPRMTKAERVMMARWNAGAAARRAGLALEEAIRLISEAACLEGEWRRSNEYNFQAPAATSAPA